MQEGTPLPLEMPGEDLFPNDAGIWTIPSQSPLVASVVAGSLDHRGIPCLGYVINEIDTPGSLDAGKVRVGAPHTALAPVVSKLTPRSRFS